MLHSTAPAPAAPFRSAPNLGAAASPTGSNPLTQWPPEAGGVPVGDVQNAPMQVWLAQPEPTAGVVGSPRTSATSVMLVMG